MKLIDKIKNKFYILPDYFLTPNRFMAECQKQSMNGQYNGSVGYMLKQTPQPEYINTGPYETMAALESATQKMRHIALQKDALLDGFVAEYGVADGTSFIPLCATIEQDDQNQNKKWTDDPIHTKVFGFDSFEGLENGGVWKGNILHKDHFKYNGEIPFKTPANGVIVKGWFKDTLPKFNYKCKIARFINLDCDNYRASKFVLNHLKKYIKPGTVISLDDYFCAYAFDKDSQFSAWKEFVEENKIKYEYLYCSAPAVVVKVVK